VLVLPALVSGQVYYARLYSWKNAVPVEGRIGIFITPSLTANGCVDEACLGPVLLENPSIEQGDYCLAAVTDIDDIEGLGVPLAPGWPRYQGGSSDGFSSCSLFGTFAEMPAQLNGITLDRTVARTGKGMGGALAWEIPYYREYLQSTLTEPLIPGEPYLVSFNAVLSPSSRHQGERAGRLPLRGSHGGRHLRTFRCRTASDHLRDGGERCVDEHLRHRSARCALGPHRHRQLLR
jgi:hypothetical protein